VKKTILNLSVDVIDKTINTKVTSMKLIKKGGGRKTKYWLVSVEWYVQTFWVYLLLIDLFNLYSVDVANLMTLKW
jgi:hypothetical protein